MSARGRVLLVMGAVALFLILFALAFGRLFLDQIASLLRWLPAVPRGRFIGWVNRTFSTSYSTEDVQRALALTPQDEPGVRRRRGRRFVGLIALVRASFLRRSRRSS